MSEFTVYLEGRAGAATNRTHAVKVNDRDWRNHLHARTDAVCGVKRCRVVLRTFDVHRVHSCQRCARVVGK